MWSRAPTDKRIQLAEAETFLVSPGPDRTKTIDLTLNMHSQPEAHLVKPTCAEDGGLFNTINF